jgi:hypothetical protein
MVQPIENAKVNDKAVKNHEAADTTHAKLLQDSTVDGHSLKGSIGASIRMSDVDPSSPESTKKAEDNLDSKVSGLLPQADQDLLKSMNHAIVEGDTKALGSAIASMKDNPEKLKSFVKELQKNLDQSDSGVKVSVTKDGNVVTYKDGDSAGVQYDSKTGEPSVVPIQNEGGNVILGNGEVLNKTPEEVSKDIGLSAREGILGLNLKFPSIFDHLPGGDNQIPRGDNPIPGGTIPDFPNRPGLPGDNPPPIGNDPGWGLTPKFPDNIPGLGVPNPKYPDGRKPGQDPIDPGFTRPEKPDYAPSAKPLLNQHQLDSGYKGGFNDHLSAPKIDPRRILNLKSNRKPDPIETQE